MIKYLRQQPHVDFNMNDIDNESPLYEAIELSDLDLVKYLIEECGADINHREIMERTPLYFSCSLGAYEIAEYLIQRRADINAVTKIKRSVLSKTCWNG